MERGGVQVADVSVPLSGELRKCLSMCPPPREDDVVRTDCESDKTFLGKVRYGSFLPVLAQGEFLR